MCKVSVKNWQRMFAKSNLVFVNDRDNCNSRNKHKLALSCLGSETYKSIWFE